MRTQVVMASWMALALSATLAWAQAPGTAGIGPQGGTRDTDRAPAMQHGMMHPGMGMHGMAGGAGKGACGDMQRGDGAKGGCCGRCGMHGAMGRGMGEGRGMQRGRGMGMGPGGPGMGNGPRAMRRGPGGPGMGPGMMRQLDLTDAQQAKARDIHERVQRAAIRTRADLATARLDLQKLVHADRPDAKAIEAQIDRMASLRAQLEKSHMNAMIEFRGLLTPEQQKKFRELHPQGMPGPGMHGGPGGPFGLEPGDADDGPGDDGDEG